MRYDECLADIAGRLDALPPPRRAAVFWLAGTALHSALPEGAGAATWSDWFARASDLSLAFIVEGQVAPEVPRTWEDASLPTGPDASQLLNSAIICLSSPLAIAMEQQKSVGPWIEHALFPIIQAISLDRFDDVAFPDDDELEEVFSDRRTEAAVNYLTAVLADLEAGMTLDRARLRSLLQGASALAGGGKGSI